MIVRCPHCGKLLDTGGVTTPPVPSEPVDEVDLPSVVTEKIAQIAQQLSLSKRELYEFKKALAVYSKPVIMGAVDTWFTKRLAGQGKGWKYFIGICRNTKVELEQDTKSSGKRPPIVGDD